MACRRRLGGAVIQPAPRSETVVGVDLHWLEWLRPLSERRPLSGTLRQGALVRVKSVDVDLSMPVEAIGAAVGRVQFQARTRPCIAVAESSSKPTPIC